MCLLVFQFLSCVLQSTLRHVATNGCLKRWQYSLLFLDLVPLPWSRPIEAARRAHNGAHEFAECDVQLANVLFLVFATATCKTSNWCNHLLDFPLESICSIPIVTKEATHLGLSNAKVRGHGWRKRNATIIGLHYAKSLNFLLDATYVCTKPVAVYILSGFPSPIRVTFTFFTFARPSQRLRSCKGHGVTQLYKPKWARQNCT